ncbi:S-type pyocin domain-containing protein [Pseudomonas sp. HS6]|uniref:S-type pyocin domain-containing protein n=1 Tax=Pseudomonas sp. HS6 TaxID=2850559 RepID=UPI0020187371|nr:S-type pyocin domain-containing protein [Pseudomonas sp. HS6]UQS13248.1 S-type pyocin domain-containing protein [Pseudomonas sp. HS6]
MSNQDWRPGQPLPLGLTEVNPYKTPTSSPISEGGGYDRTGRTRNRSRTGTDLFTQLSRQDIAEINEALFISDTVQNIEASKQEIAHDHQVKLGQLPNTLQSEITSATSSMGGTHGLSPVQTLTRQQAAINHLIHKKSAERNMHQTRANAFYGGDPLIRTQQDLVEAYLRVPAAEVPHRWRDSYTSAYALNRNTEEIRQLTDRLHTLSFQIAQAYAQASAQRLAELQAEAIARAAHAKAAAEQSARDAAHRAALAEAEAELARQREVEKQAEHKRKHTAASDAANRFDTLLSELTPNQLESIDERIRWMKNKHRKLYLAHVEASKAEREFKDFYNFRRRSKRWSTIKNLQNEISTLIRQKNTITKLELPTLDGVMTSARPLVVSSDGLIAGFEGSPLTLGKALDTLGALRGAISAGPVSTFLASVFYTPTLGNGELQRSPLILTIPLSQLAQNDEHVALPGSAEANWLPARAVSSVKGEHTQLYLRSADPGQTVRVRQAKFNRSDNLYTFTTEGLFPITLTWTPKTPPGDDIPDTTELPATDSGTRIYPGARVTQIEGRLDEHPACEIDDPDDYILTFPIESGIESIYMMATRGGPRYEPGTAKGKGQEVGENWLGGARESSGAPVPAQIADQLRNQDFRNFDRFREKFWKAVASDELLSEQFGRVDLKQMRGGSAPNSDPSDNVGRRDKYEIHHKQRIADGGAVYDVENLSILTPQAHIELHKKGNQQ